MEIFLIRSYRKIRRRCHIPSSVEFVVAHRRAFVLPMNGLNYNGLLVHKIETVRRGSDRLADYAVCWKDYLKEGNLAKFGYRLRFVWVGNAGLEDSGKSVPIRAEIALLNYFTGSLLQVIPISLAASQEYFAKSYQGPLISTLREVGQVELTACFHGLTIVVGPSRTCSHFSRLEKMQDPESCSALISGYLSASGLQNFQSPLWSVKTKSLQPILQQLLTHLAELLIYCTHAHPSEELRPSITPAIEHATQVIAAINTVFLVPLTNLESKSYLRSALGKSLNALSKLMESVAALGTPKSAKAVEAIAKGAFKLTTAVKSTEITPEEETLLLESLSRSDKDKVDLLTFLDLEPAETLALALYQHHEQLKRPKDPNLSIGAGRTENFRFVLKDKGVAFSRLTEEQSFTFKLPEVMCDRQLTLLSKTLPGDTMVVRSANAQPRYFLVSLLEQYSLMKTGELPSFKSGRSRLLPSPWIDHQTEYYHDWDQKVLYLVGVCHKETHLVIHRLCTDSYFTRKQGWASQVIVTGLRDHMDVLFSNRNILITPSRNRRKIYVAVYLKKIDLYSLTCLEYSAKSNSLRITASSEEGQNAKSRNGQRRNLKPVAWWTWRNLTFALAIEHENILAVHYHSKNTFVAVSRIAGVTTDESGRVTLADTVSVVQKPKSRNIAVVCSKYNTNREQTGYPELVTWSLRPNF